MYRNDIVGQNTLYVNDIMVRIFKIMLLTLAIVVILKASGIITLPWLHLIIMTSTGVVACVLPIAWRHFRMGALGLKYVNIYCAAALYTFLYSYLNMGLIMLLVIPIGFACLYFDTKLIRHSVILSVLGLLPVEVLGSAANWGFAITAEERYIRMAADILQFGIAAVLLIAISRRTVFMLSNTHSFYENIDSILSIAGASSKSLETASDILLQGVNSLSSNEKKEELFVPGEEDASPSNTKVNEIISNINKSMENAKEIIKYTQTMLKSKGKDLKAGDEVARIEEYTKNSRELISKLADYTEKIKEDVSLISVMIDESKLLSANAAAEAENASSGGKGSAILAMKVEKLADESAKSATHIHGLLKNIVNDAENTVNSVAEAYEEIFKSLELINRTVETLIKWLMYKNIK